MQKSMVCQFTAIDAAGLLQSAIGGPMTNTKAAIAQPSTLSKAHPFSKLEILKEMAILKPMGTFTLKAMKVRRPSLLLLHSPTRSNGSISFLALTSSRSMISPDVPHLSIQLARFVLVARWLVRLFVVLPVPLSLAPLKIYHLVTAAGNSRPWLMHRPRLRNTSGVVCSRPLPHHRHPRAI